MKIVRPYISKSEASRRSGIRRAAIYELIDVGAIPADEKGRILRADFERWLLVKQGAPTDGQE